MRTSYALRLFSFLWLCGTGISADKKNVKEEVRILDLLNHDKLKIDVEQVKAGEVYGLVRFYKGSDGSWKSNCPSLKGPENDAQEVTPANEVSTNKAPEQGQSSSIRDIITDPHYLGKGEPERAANILELGKVNMLTAPKVPAGMQVLGLGLEFVNYVDGAQEEDEDGDAKNLQKTLHAKQGNQDGKPVDRALKPSDKSPQNGKQNTPTVQKQASAVRA